MEPVRLGQVPPVPSAADRFVTVESDQGPLLRVDLYRSNDQCFAFEEVRVWCDFLAIGWGERLFLVNLLSRAAFTLHLGSYFGHIYLTENCLVVASAERLFCIAQDGSVLWQSAVLGIDGVIVDDVEGDLVQGRGEWDPPDGWRPFSVSLQTGQVVCPPQLQ
jgi:hypothetical protein